MTAHVKSTMIKHLLFPWRWVDCSDPENCVNVVHISGYSSEMLNFMPPEWVQPLLMEPLTSGSELTSTAIVSYENDYVFFYDEQHELHKTNGPAVIKADGSKEWWDSGIRTNNKMLKK